MSYIYTVSDLFYKDYSIKAVAGDNPHIIDKRDSGKFNRYERYEVLDLINAVARHQNFTTKKQSRLIELLIRVDLPTQFAYDRAGALSWLVFNYKGFHIVPEHPAAKV